MDTPQLPAQQVAQFIGGPFAGQYRLIEGRSIEYATLRSPVPFMADADEPPEVVPIERRAYRLWPYRPCWDAASFDVYVDQTLLGADGRPRPGTAALLGEWFV